MKNRFLLSSLIFVCVLFPRIARTETVLEKIVRTGELRAGARSDSTPFGYIGETGDLQGYSVDLLFLIHRRLEEKLGKLIVLNLSVVTVNSRFREVKQGRLDIVCEATTITPERSEKVDFSDPFFVTGPQFLVKKSDVNEFNINSNLYGQAIAYIPSTTTFDAIPLLYPSVEWIEVKNRKEGLAKLKKGEVKSVVSDGILLVGELVGNGDDPRQFTLLPPRPLTSDLYGCILPKNNEDWKQVVNDAIASPENHELREEWFNLSKSKFPYSTKPDQ